MAVFGMRRRIKWLVGVCIAGCAAIAVLMSFPEFFLRIADVPTRCDAIVLLGGATGERDPVAIGLYKRDMAPIVIVTGAGDCLDNFHRLSNNGVPTNAIVMECASISTKENAEAIALIAQERHLTNVVIVTSWFHARRAVSTVRKFAPKLRVYVAVADIHSPPRYERRKVASEYAKILFYAVRWRVLPWS